MKKLLIISILTAGMFLGTAACAQTQETGGQWAVVNVSDLIMRSKPSYTSAGESQTRMGTLVEVLDHQGYWVKIKSPEPYEGWVNELTVSTANPKAFLGSKRIILCKNANLKVYADRDTRSAVIRTMIMGNMVELANEDGVLRRLSWNKVRLADGQTGWIQGNFGALEVLDEWAAKEKAEDGDGKIKDIIATAKDFLGCPYLWAGMSPGHFDCSGLTGFCYFMNGILLPRDASQQIKCGVEVSFEDMQAGDLVFFGDTSVGHVALCIGNHKIIHSSQLVRINSLLQGEPDYYSRNILGIRRIIGHIGEGSDGYAPSWLADSPAYFLQTK